MELEEKFEETNNDDESVVPDEKSVDELSVLKKELELSLIHI